MLKHALAFILLSGSSAIAASPPFLLPPQGGNAGKYLQTNGTKPSWASVTGGVTSVTASSPMFSSGGTTPNLTIQAADSTHNGYLTLGDWSLFNAKQSALIFSLPLVNTSGTVSIPPATSSANGYLTSSDWTTFNSKQPAGSYVTTARSINTTAPLAGGGTLSSDLTLSMPAATSLANGYLTSSDWSMFNGKQSALTFGSASTSTPGVTVTGTNATVGPSIIVNVQTASGSQPGLLSAADWSTFNGKQSALTLGALSDPGTDGITVTGGTGAVVGSGTSLSQHVSDSTHNGYLSSADWSTFNAKQAAGSYLTALTSDVSASGPGSAAATVNSVGGSTAAAVNTATVLANAATALNTANAIMRRDSGGAVSATFNYGPTTSADWSWTTTPTTHGGALDSIANWIKNVATNLSALLDTRTLYVSKTAILASDSNSCSYFLPCVTIQRGINVANGIAAYYKQVAVRVEPGITSSSYTENVTLSQQGVNLICADAGFFSRACNVTGTLTVNLTGVAGGAQFIAASNEVKIKGFTFASGSGDAVTFSGTTFQRLIAESCYFQATAGHSAVVSNTGFSGATPSEFRSYDTTFENNSSTVPSVVQSAGRFWLYGTTPTVQNNNAAGPSYLHNPTATTTGNLTSGSACIASPGALTNIVVGQKISDTTSLGNSVNIPAGTTVAGLPGTCSAGQIQMSANAAGTETSAALNFGGSSMIANITQFSGQYQLVDNTATATFNLATIASGTNSCIVTPTIPNVGYALWAYAGCNSSNANVFTGTGIVVFATGNACIGTACSAASTVTTSSLGKMPEGGAFINGSTGALTSLTTNQIVGYGKTVRAMRIENMVGAAAVFTCSVNPGLTLYDCGTSAGACTAGRTALANVTLTAANTGTNGSVTSATLAAGHYWAMEISAGTCTALNANVSAEGANQ